MVNPKKCVFCEYYHKRSKEEIFNCKSPEEEQSFNGYCHRYPKQEKVKYNYACDEWKNKADSCIFVSIKGICILDIFKRLCNDCECHIDLHEE